MNCPVWTDDAEDAVLDDAGGNNTTGENAHEVTISVLARSRIVATVFIVLMVYVYMRVFAAVQSGAKKMTQEQWSWKDNRNVRPVKSTIGMAIFSNGDDGTTYTSVHVYSNSVVLT